MAKKITLNLTDAEAITIANGLLLLQQQHQGVGLPCFTEKRLRDQIESARTEA